MTVGLMCNDFDWLQALAGSKPYNTERAEEYKAFLEKRYKPKKVKIMKKAPA